MFILEEWYSDPASKRFSNKIVGRFETEKGAFEYARSLINTIPDAIHHFNIPAIIEDDYACSYASKVEPWQRDYYIRKTNSPYNENYISNVK